MMRSTVFAHYTRSVKTHHYVEVVYRHIVYDVIVGTLSKSAVYVTERHQSLFRHTSRERYGMSLCYTHVEGSVRHLVHHDVHRATRRHCRRHAHYLFVLSCQLYQRSAKHLLILHGLFVRRLLDALTRLSVKLAWSMPYSSRLLGWLIALALYGVYVQQLRTAHALQLSQYPHQFLHVVTVHRAEIAYIHALKHVGL